jgi:Protein of unknown function (DUF1194)
MGGPDAFVLQIDHLRSFADAMVTKLLTEISARECDWKHALAAR